MSFRIGREKWAGRKTVVLPAWAKQVRLVVNNIDGWSRNDDGVYQVSEFIFNAGQFQMLGGMGEWEVLVYGVSTWDKDPKIVQPYGQDNPYRELKSGGGVRVKKLACFDYMYRKFYDFKTAAEYLGITQAEAEAMLKPV